MSQNLDDAKISIIIPVLNEAENIRQAIACTQLSTNIEVIVVDGGSQDDTHKIASDLNVTIISSLPGRGSPNEQRCKTGKRGYSAISSCRYTFAHRILMS